MKYVESVNLALSAQLSSYDQVVLYGQNVAAGSRLGGVARGLDVLPGVCAINSTNSENALVGCGFGMMLGQMPSMLLLKQQDFLFLAVDQLVNTWNLLRDRPLHAGTPFVIAFLVVDSGWEGAQSGANAASLISSTARIPCYWLTADCDMRQVTREAFSGGPAMLAISQRQLGSELPDVEDRLTLLGSGFRVYSWKRPDESRSIALLCTGFTSYSAFEWAEHNSHYSDVRIVSFSQFPLPDVSEFLPAVNDVHEIWILSDEKVLHGGAASDLCLALRDMPHLRDTRISIIRRKDHEKWSRPSKDLFVIAPE